MTSTNARQASTSIDPTIARRRLGIKLRELRQARSLRLEDAAASIGVVPSTLSRIETGKAPTRRGYLSSLLDLYGVTDPELLQLLADLAVEGEWRPWWAACNDLLPNGTGRYLGLEAAACLVRSYSTQTVPALLQTADYATAVCHAARPSLTADQIRKLVVITMHRQEILHHSGTHLHMIIDETALLRSIASPDVMTAQLDHLLTLDARPSVTVQIAPLATRMSVLSPPLTVLSFTDPTDDDVAVSYDPGGQLTIAAHYCDASVTLATFTTLGHEALSPADSVKMIRDLRR